MAVWLQAKITLFVKKFGQVPKKSREELGSIGLNIARSGAFYRSRSYTSTRPTPVCRLQPRTIAV